MKAHTREENNYNGLRTENVNHKFLYFSNRYEQWDVLELLKTMPFSISLKGIALQHYFDTIRCTNHFWEKHVTLTGESLTTTEYTRSFIREWAETTIRPIVAKSRDKALMEKLEALVSGLQDILSLLSEHYMHKEILHNNMLNAVNIVEACRIAYTFSTKFRLCLVWDLHALLIAALPALADKLNPVLHMSSTSLKKTLQR